MPYSSSSIVCFLASSPLNDTSSIMPGTPIWLCIGWSAGFCMLVKSSKHRTDLRKSVLLRSVDGAYCLSFILPQSLSNRRRFSAVYSVLICVWVIIISLLNIVKIYKVSYSTNYPFFQGVFRKPFHHFAKSSCFQKDPLPLFKCIYRKKTEYRFPFRHTLFCVPLKISFPGSKCL